MDEQWFQFAMVSLGAIVAPTMIYIAKSLGELNIKIAVVISRLDTHDHRIGRLEDKYGTDSKDN